MSPWRSLLPLVLAGSVVPHLLYVGWVARQNLHPDLFGYRAGAGLALRGVSPYPPDRVPPLVAAQFPGLPDIGPNWGFFLPPEGILLLAPLAVLPWPAAKAVWVTVVTAVGAVGAVALTATFGRNPERLPRLSLAVPPVLLLNPITLSAQVPGQTSLLALGCVAVGQWFFERGRAVPGTLLWAVPFVKPHVALPLLPLAWFLGGWRRAAGLGVAVAGLNIAGGLVSTGSPLLALEYVRGLADRHQSIPFNTAAGNPQFAGWNRAAIAAGGPVVELRVTGTLIGSAVWLGLLAVRAWRAGVRPSPAWAAAAAGVGTVLCSQALVYEFLILALAVPHALDLWEGGRRRWAVALAALLLIQTVPQPPVADFVAGLGVGGRVQEVLVSYRSFGVLSAAAVVLLGPVNPTRR